MVEFLVEAGPERGASFTVDGHRATLGRSADNTCPLPLDEQVAPRHAVVMQRSGEWYIAPARRTQTEAVLLNDRPVRRPTRLRYGDRITLGQTTLEYSYPTDSLEQALPQWQFSAGRRLPNILWAMFVCLITIASAVSLFRQNLPANTLAGQPTATESPQVAMGNASPAAPPVASPPTAPPTLAPTATPTGAPPQPAADTAATANVPAPTVTAPTPTPVPPTPTARPTLAPTAPPPTPTPDIAIAVFTAHPAASPAAPFITLANGCQVPTNWQRYTVQWGDTLWKIAERFQTSAPVLIETNCLDDETIYADAELYVPPTP